VFPEARLQVGSAFRSYIRDKVRLEFDGIDLREGIIGEAVDEATGIVDEAVTIGGLVTIHGSGLKIESDGAHKADAGLYFEDGAGTRVKAAILAVNEPRTLKAIAPAGLTAGTAYHLLVVTQSTVKSGGALLKNVREVRSEFTLTAQTGS
jgi:hypothetical protein